MSTRPSKVTSPPLPTASAFPLTSTSRSPGHGVPLTSSSSPVECQRGVLREVSYETSSSEDMSRSPNQDWLPISSSLSSSHPISSMSVSRSTDLARWLPPSIRRSDAFTYGTPTETSSEDPYVPSSAATFPSASLSSPSAYSDHNGQPQPFATPTRHPLSTLAPPPAPHAPRRAVQGAGNARPTRLFEHEKQMTSQNDHHDQARSVPLRTGLSQHVYPALTSIIHAYRERYGMMKDALNDIDGIIRVNEGGWRGLLGVLPIAKNEVAEMKHQLVELK